MQIENDHLEQLNKFINFCSELSNKKPLEKYKDFQAFRKAQKNFFVAAWATYRLSDETMTKIRQVKYAIEISHDATKLAAKDTFNIHPWFVESFYYSSSWGHLIALTSKVRHLFTGGRLLMLQHKGIARGVCAIEIVNQENWEEKFQSLLKERGGRNKWNKKTRYLSEDFDIDSLIAQLTDLRLKRMKENDKI